MQSLKVQKIWAADICRDGGSYSFCFDSDDGQWYEFLLQTRAFEQSRAQEGHHPPVIYLKSANDRRPVQQLTWEEARVFIAPLHFDKQRFHELVAIVMRGGKMEDHPPDDQLSTGTPR